MIEQGAIAENSMTTEAIRELGPDLKEIRRVVHDLRDAFNTYFDINSDTHPFEELSKEPDRFLDHVTYAYLRGYQHTKQLEEILRRPMPDDPRLAANTRAWLLEQGCAEEHLEMVQGLLLKYRNLEGMPSADNVANYTLEGRCPVHGDVFHGREAQELRDTIQALLEMLDEMTEEHKARDTVDHEYLLDHMRECMEHWINDTPASDSALYLERSEEWRPNMLAILNGSYNRATRVIVDQQARIEQLEKALQEAKGERL